MGDAYCCLSLHPLGRCVIIRAKSPNTEKIMFIANADAPVSPPVQALYVKTAPKSSVKCQIFNTVVQVRPEVLFAFSPADNVVCFSPEKVVKVERMNLSELPEGVPIVDVTKPGTCLSSGLFQLRKPGKVPMCAPKGVKAGIRG
jgi:hypothetical protein